MTRKEYTHQQWLKRHRVNEDGVIERYCASCDTWKEESEEYFYLANKSKPEKGFSGECKACASIRADINQRENYERKLEFQKKYDRKPERLPIRREHAKRTRESGYYQMYFAKYPEKLIKYGEDRRHKNHKINTREWKACKEYFKDDDGDYCCAYCGLKIQNHTRIYAGKVQYIDLHKEHVDHDGSDGLNNCVPSCGTCNERKWKFTLEEWYNEDNNNFTENRLEKIFKWLTEDYIKFEDQKYKEKRARKLNKVS